MYNTLIILKMQNFQNTDMVIEAVFEDLNIKHKVIKEIEEVWPIVLCNKLCTMWKVLKSASVSLTWSDLECFYSLMHCWEQPCEKYPKFMWKPCEICVRFHRDFSWRLGGLIVSAHNSGLSNPGSSPGQDIVLCSWARHLTLTVPLSAQVYKWVPEQI